MTLDQWLNDAVKHLERAGIGTARLDCLVLLEDVLQTNRAQLLAHLERKLTAAQHGSLQKLINLRATHEPLAYLRHKTEFYGREFHVNHSVLEPRPESETMIDLLKSMRLPSQPILADIGTGSGALAATAKLELPEATVFATDIDAACLRVAARNTSSHQVDVKLFRGNLLEPLIQKNILPDVLLCNLPYVPDSFQINPAAMREPRLAIFGGPDGLDPYRQLFTQSKALPQRPHFVLTEAMPPQHSSLTNIATDAGYSLADADDFIQVFSTK